MTSTAERRSGAPTHLRLLAFLIAVAATPDAIHGAESRDLVLSNVTVVSPERAAPLADAWLAIRDGRIAAVGGAATDPDDSFREARVVDGKGRYVTPGLIDSHVHLASIPGVPYPTPPELSDIVAAYEAQLPRGYHAPPSPLRTPVGDGDRDRSPFGTVTGGDPETRAAELRSLSRIVRAASTRASAARRSSVSPDGPGCRRRPR